ncbi:hypothetical protein J3R30DRAFT_3697095 [Lentinula aciculospora]|uniref:Uncharacterized protein n=1 Tax=Lentinula aciculospora TaxID=153920 RepID=A0A9W9ANB2_9AGAR|nr:hypothetical protein J3R30DRAFT_3697095 [Lentinula aciculospora]
MSLTFLKQSLARPMHRVIVGSATVIFGCLGFMLSVITVVIHFSFPDLLRPRGPQKSHTVSRTSSRQTIRRRDETKSPPSTAGSSPSFELSVDARNSSNLRSSYPPHSLKSSSSAPTEMHTSLPYPVDDYFPPMDPTPKIPHVVVIKTSLDEGTRRSPPTQRLESTGRRPAAVSASGTDCTLRGSRSMSFFRSKGHQRTPSDPPTSRTPPSPSSEGSTREKDKKKKNIQAVRQRTQPYEAPYFFPTPVSSSTEYLRPRLDPVRSQTMPLSPRRVT